MTSKSGFLKGCQCLKYLHDQREISHKASASDTMAIKMRMNLAFLYYFFSIWYFFSNIKPVKNNIYSWQVSLTESFIGDKNVACPDITYAKSFYAFSMLPCWLLLHTTKSYFKWNSIKKKSCMRAVVERGTEIYTSLSLSQYAHIYV